MAKADERLSGTAVAALLHVTSAAVTLWKSQGCPYEDTKSGPRYLLHKVHEWRIEQAKRSATSDRPDKAEEEARKLRAQADIAEMDRDERAASLVARAAVEAAQMAENVRARAILLAIPGTYGRDFADALKAPIRDAAHALDTMVRSVLETLASDDDDELEESA